MIPFDTALLFFTTSILLALTPGPDNLFVLAQSAQHGKRAGLIVTLGLCTGVLFHTAAVSLGVAAIFQSSLLAFAVLKYVGAAYLLYLAYQSFRAGGSIEDKANLTRLGFLPLFRRGVIMNITNPKVSIFFLAFFPQFVDPANGAIIPQMLVLAILFIGSTIWIFGGISLLAGTFGQLLAKSEKAQKFLNRGAGTVFAGLAVKLIVSHR